MLANYHTHTTRCNHAEGTEREYIETAIKNGFKILGFSDHTPQPYPPGCHSSIRMDMEELENYTDTLVKLRDEYKKDIQLFIGLEVEYSDKYFEPLMKHVRQYPLDYIIQGQHHAPNEIDGFYAGFETTDEAKLKEYVDYTVEGMKTGLFSYLAHPDLMNYVGPDMVYQHHMKRIVKTSIDLDIPLEINMQGFFLNRNYPSDRFFSMASAMGAKFDIGCDAHHPEDVMQPWQMQDFEAFLDKNNITYGDNIIKLRPVK